MILKKLPLIVQFLLISSVFFLIHFSVVAFFSKINVLGFLLSYALQFIISFAIFMAVKKIYEIAKDQLGFAFLGLSSFKVIISYVFVTNYLFLDKTMIENNKINFFITFLFFLSLDVYFTIRLLNKK